MSAVETTNCADLLDPSTTRRDDGVFLGTTEAAIPHDCSPLVVRERVGGDGDGRRRDPGPS